MQEKNRQKAKPNKDGRKKSRVIKYDDENSQRNKRGKKKSKKD